MGFCSYLCTGGGKKKDSPKEYNFGPPRKLGKVDSGAAFNFFNDSCTSSYNFPPCIGMVMLQKLYHLLYMMKNLKSLDFVVYTVCNGLF